MIIIIYQEMYIYILLISVMCLNEIGINKRSWVDSVRVGIIGDPL